MEQRTEIKDNMNLSKGFVYYFFAILFIALFTSFIVFLTNVEIIERTAKWPLLIILGGYVGAGIFLGKKVLNKLIEWHPVYSTIDNIASGKIRQIILWPIAYPLLFIKLYIAEKL